MIELTLRFPFSGEVKAIPPLAISTVAFASSLYGIEIRDYRMRNWPGARKDQIYSLIFGLNALISRL